MRNICKLHIKISNSYQQDVISFPSAVSMFGSSACVMESYYKIPGFKNASMQVSIEHKKVIPFSWVVTNFKVLGDPQV